jgi:Plavaka transposase
MSTDNLFVLFFTSVKPSYPLRLGRIPRHFEDVSLSDEDANYSDAVDAPPARNADPPESRIRRVLLMLRDTLQTSFNSFGLCRLYPRRPSFEPDQFVPSSLLSTTCPTVIQETDSPGILPPPYPFPSMTIYRLISWMNSGSNQKSETEMSRLVKEVMLAEDFNTKDLEDFSVRKSLRELDNDPAGKKIKFPDDWMEASVTIQIPMKSKEDEARPFSVSGLHFRPLVEVIRSAFTDIQASAFHLSPFKRLWKDPLDNHQEHIYDELYTSDSWLDAQDEVQKLPREPGCKLERVVAGLMFFSDATHLANFGTAKAWPLYMYFGNLTKYARSAPKSGACHLVGFLPSVSFPTVPFKRHFHVCASVT